MTLQASGPWFEADGVHSVRPLDALTLAALAYLAIPVLIFCAGWLRPAYAIAAVPLLLVAIGAALRPRDLQWRLPGKAGPLLLAAATGFAWAAFGGAGHFFYANPDWLLRDAVLMDLVHTPWPPSYGEQDGAAMILRTALAYYLPAAALGAIFGPQSADLILYVWTGLGAALFLMLLPFPQGPVRLVVALALVVLFSGMDAAGVLMIAGYLPANALHLEWWAHPLQYSSHTTQLFWVPNHALPAWIAMALFYRHWGAPAFWPVGILATVLLPLWTPFAALGMAPFIAYLAACRLRQGLGLRLPLALIVPAALLLALQARYLGLGFEVLAASVPSEVTFSAGKSTAKYGRFMLLEFALLGFALFALLRHSRGLWAIALLTLAALPFVNFGPANDVVMRASIPSLALLAILCVRAIDETQASTADRIPRALVIAMLTIGATTPAYEFWRALSRPPWPPSNERTLPEAALGLAPHYFGRLDREDVKAVLRNPTLVSPRRAP